MGGLTAYTLRYALSLTVVDALELSCSDALFESIGCVCENSFVDLLGQLSVSIVGNPEFVKLLHTSRRRNEKFDFLPFAKTMFGPMVELLSRADVEPCIKRSAEAPQLGVDIHGYRIMYILPSCIGAHGHCGVAPTEGAIAVHCRGEY